MRTFVFNCIWTFGGFFFLSVCFGVLSLFHCAVTYVTDKDEFNWNEILLMRLIISFSCFLPKRRSFIYLLLILILNEMKVLLYVENEIINHRGIMIVFLKFLFYFVLTSRRHLRHFSRKFINFKLLLNKISCTCTRHCFHLQTMAASKRANGMPSVFVARQSLNDEELVSAEWKWYHFTLILLLLWSPHSYLSSFLIILKVIMDWISFISFMLKKSSMQYLKIISNLFFTLQNLSIT